MIKTSQPSSWKDLPQQHLLAPGTAMCPGCGGLQVIKLMYDLLGENIVVVNAAGCMTLLSVYPTTPFQSSWLYTSMASAAAGAQGIRDALDILLERRKLEHENDLKVVVLMGDGSANGIALSATCAAIDRGLDFYGIAYDNEGYGNTGHQSSAATPHGARSATDAGGLGVAGEKKDLFAVWAAHQPAYLATICGSDPLDLAQKFQKARALTGPKMFIALAPCPTGWDFAPKDMITIGRLAVKCGIWPLKEYCGGHVHHTRRPKPRRPVEEYLRMQGRFQHLFGPERDAIAIANIQSCVDHYWENS